MNRSSGSKVYTCTIEDGNMQIDTHVQFQAVVNDSKIIIPNFGFQSRAPDFSTKNPEKSISSGTMAFYS